jgi:crossover junction endodeoxyribonuclease RuvC
MDLIFSQTARVPTKESPSACTRRIFEAISDTLKCYDPAICAAEQTIQMALLTAIAIHHVPALKYAPFRIRQAICRYGRATKEQISKMVQAILKIHVNVGFDEIDAAAVAICCFFTECFLSCGQAKPIKVAEEY